MEEKLGHVDQVSTSDVRQLLNFLGGRSVPPSEEGICISARVAVCCWVVRNPHHKKVPDSLEFELRSGHFVGLVAGVLGAMFS